MELFVSCDLTNVCVFPLRCIKALSSKSVNLRYVHIIAHRVLLTSASCVCRDTVRIWASLQDQQHLSKQLFLHEWWSNVSFILLVHCCLPALFYCSLSMQDGKWSVKSGAMCIHWSASKMSSKMLNSWVVPIWPQFWSLIWSAAGFSAGNLVTSELRN